jgi:hypothetical protein
MSEKSERATCRPATIVMSGVWDYGRKQPSCNLI